MLKRRSCGRIHAHSNHTTQDHISREAHRARTRDLRLYVDWQTDFTYLKVIGWG